MFTKQTNHWRVIAILGLLFALLCTTCALEGTDQPEITRQADIVNAQEPIITAQPAVGLALEVGATTGSLTVTANLQDDGALSYQWLTYTDLADYEADTGTPAAGTGATTATFYPPTDVDGVFYYYVRVTNTLAGATGRQTASTKSDRSIVTINDPNAAEYPAITALSGDGYYLAPAASITLEVTAAITSGSLSYKWYSAEGPAITGGDELPGETGAALTKTSVAAGTYYYYVEVTNTDTSKSGRQESTVVSPFVVNVVVANATFTVDTDTEYQYVRGFGGMYTPWDNAPQEYPADFERMFSPNGLGMNILRIMILPNSTNIRDTMTNITTGKDGDGKDQSNYYEFVKIVNKYGGYVLASPWSPPALWKTNDSVNGGGTLRSNRYRNFANYLATFCMVMNENEAPIYAVSMQNEPTFEAQYDGCEYSTEEHRAWWEEVGHFTTENRLPNPPVARVVAGWGGGVEQPHVLTMTGESHNNVSPFHTAAESALQDPVTRPYIDLVGRHVYGSGINPIPFNQRHDKEVWMTEHNINSGSGSYHLDSTWNYVWKFMNDVDLTVRHNQENAFIWWTAKRFYSFIGDGENGTTDGAIMARGWGIAHYSRFAKEMTRVKVDATGTTAAGVAISANNVNNSSFNIDSTDVKLTAYKSADGNTISLVMYTPTDSSGGGGSEMGIVKIKLPDGWLAAWATAMRSTSDPLVRGQIEGVTICEDKNSAIVNLPRSQMLSVKFFREP